MKFLPTVRDKAMGEKKLLSSRHLLPHQSVEKLWGCLPHDQSVNQLQKDIPTIFATPKCHGMKVLDDMDGCIARGR